MLSFASRCFLASYFVVDGVRAAVDPQPRVADAEPQAEKFVECVERYLPDTIARHVPAKTDQLVRLHGLVQAAGGILYATGLSRRLGAAIMAAAYVPKVIAARPTLQDKDKGVFVRELALLGGALVAAGDRGKPHYVRVAVGQGQTVVAATPPQVPKVRPPRKAKAAQA